MVKRLLAFLVALTAVTVLFAGLAAAAPPAAPSLVLPPTPDADGQFRLIWSKPVGATSFTLEQSLNAGAFAPVYSGTGYFFTTLYLAPGTYTYRVKASNVDGDSAYTAGAYGIVVPAVVPPPALISLPATSATGRFTVSIAATPISGATYVLEESLLGDFSDASVAYSGTRNTVTLTKTAGSYSYRAKATKASYADSTYTAVKSIVVGTPKALPPAAVSVPALDADGTFTVNISPSGTPGATYLLQESVLGDFSDATTVSSGAPRVISVAGKAAGSQYSYRAKAMAAGMTDSDWTAVKSIIVANSNYCVACHDGGAASDILTAWGSGRHANGNSNPGAYNYTCAGCHSANAEVTGTGQMMTGCIACHALASDAHPADANVNTLVVCSTCHNSHKSADSQIASKVAAGAHGAATGFLTGTCQRCHTTFGSLEGASRGWTGSYATLTANQATLWTPAPTGATDGIFCNACHDPHTGNMRAINTYSGGTTVAWDPNGNAVADQYDTCTGCHTLTDNAGAVVGNYHNGGSINTTRTISDTHYDNPATGVGLASNVVEGYAIRATSASPCADCHDVHSADVTIQEAWAVSAHSGKIMTKKDEAACTESITWFNATYPTNPAFPVAACTTTATVGTSTRTVLEFFQRNEAGIAFYPTVGAVDDADGNAWTHYNWDQSTGAGNRGSCQRCHTATGASNFLSNPAGYDATGAGNNFSHLSGWTAGTGSPQNELLYCWGCHSDVSTGALRNPGAITEQYAAATTGGPVVTVSYPNLNESNVCMGCHLGREVGQNVATDIDADGVRSFINSHYLTAGATIFSESGYEYAGRSYSSGFHQNVGRSNNFGTGTAGPCATCHMTGAEPHSFEVLSTNGSPASPLCAQCHTTLDAAALNTARSTFDTALNELQLALESKGIYYATSYPYFFNGAGGTGGAFTNWAGVYGLAEWKNVMGAAFNYNLLHHDPGAYAHNRQYALDLIADSIDYIVDGTIDGQGGAFLIDAVEAGEDGSHVAFAATDCTPCHTSGLPGPPVLPSNTAAHALTGVPAVSNVSFAVAGADLVLSYNLKIDGVNAAGYTVVNRDYRLDGATGDRLDLGTVTTATDNGSGNYSVTLPGAAANANSRYLLRVTNASGLVRALVVGNYPASPVTTLVADSACTDCHGNQTDGFHYSYPVSAQQCVVCHDAANTTYPRLYVLGHGIHNSHNMASGHFELDEQNVFSVTFPTYMNNCANCHRDPAALAIVNAEPVSYDFCMSCHGGFAFFDHGTGVAGPEFGNIDHAGFTSATNCAGCHDGVTAGDAITDFHNGLMTERGGLIWDGQDVSVVAGNKVDLNITGITRSGANLLVSWTADYNSLPVDPCNTTVASAAPIFHAGGAANATTGQAASNFSFIKGFAVKEDFVNPGIGTSPGQPGSAVNITTGNTVCVGNVATTTVALTAAEQAFSMGRIGMQGKAQVKLPYVYDGGTKDVIQVRSAGPTRDFMVADGSLPATPRREVVDTASCLKCHPGSLYQHGGNRIDNVELCIICHNEASSEQNVRLLDGVDSTEAYDGKVGQTYGFKSLLHAVHSAGHNEAVTMVYRTIGNYVWSGNGSVIPNYPATDVFGDSPVGGGVAALIYGSSAPAGTGPTTVFGSLGTLYDPRGTNPNTPYDGTSEWQVYRAHNLHQTTYPQVLNNCASCHKPGSFGFPDATKAVATTVDAGTVALGGTKPSQTASSATNAIQTDDVLQGPAAAACFSCHQAVMAPPVNHGNVGGFAPATFPGDRLGVPAETCSGCHTP